jgi:hypothetical protein
VGCFKKRVVTKIPLLTMRGTNGGGDFNTVVRQLLEE